MASGSSSKMVYSIKDLKEAMSDPGCWANEIVSEASAVALNITIKIVQRNITTKRYHVTNTFNPQGRIDIYILCDLTSFHYEGMVPSVWLSEIPTSPKRKS